MKLKKCPICGGEAKIEIRTFVDGYRIFYPRCSNGDCIANVMFGVSYKTKEEAAEAWNRRVEE